MKKTSLLLILSFYIVNLFTQQANSKNHINSKLIDLGEVTDENFIGYEKLKEILGNNVEIIMLGEESHKDGTAFETKIKLIKYLHKEMDFDILTFEGGFYECHNAWQLMQKGEDVRTLFGKSVNSLWSITKEFIPLVKYIEENLNTNNPLMIAGFDNQLMLGENRLSKFYIKNLKEYLKKTNISGDFNKELEYLNSSIELMLQYKFKKYKQKAAIRDTIFINKLINLIASSTKDVRTSFWQQSLKNLKACISDAKLGTYYRDYQMAQNLIWLKERYPNKKIICWGATSHFLYNSKTIRMDSKVVQLLGGRDYKEDYMMGHYIKGKYKDKAYTIGFIAHEGSYGHDSRRELPLPKENSLENLIGKSKYNNCLLPLNGLSLGEYLSRPLAYYYMKTDIAKVMDAVIFNRYMKPATPDYNFYFQIYPENENEKLKRKLNLK